MPEEAMHQPVAPHPVPPPLAISFVARSGTGKTTFLAGLVPALKALGLRVGVLKHHAHATPFDVPGKDTYRLSQAGADVVVGACPVQTAVFIDEDATADLDAVIRQHLNAVDVVLVEGYKRGDYPKIELHRAAIAAQDDHGAALLCVPDELVALVTDTPLPLPETVPQFAFDAVAEVARLIRDLHVTASRRQQE